VLLLYSQTLIGFFGEGKNMKTGRLFLVATDNNPVGPRGQSDSFAKQIVRSARVARGLATKGATRPVIFTGEDPSSREMALTVIEWMKHPTIALTASPKLNDRDWGGLSMLTKDAIDRRYSQLEQDLWLSTWKSTALGCESLRQVLQRVGPFLAQDIWNQQAKGEDVVVVSAFAPALAIKVFLKQAQQRSFTQLSPLVPTAYLFDEHAKVVQEQPFVRQL
jgi:bisphosphoglycerate-dependent phosphoglycerate mutase